jgi:hypothetical protein
MSIILFILILVMAAGAVYALARGVIGMAQGKDLTGQRSQELMRKRVMYQALAIVFIVIFLLMASGGRH